MKPADQARADAANNSYKNRSRSEVDGPEAVFLGGEKYQIFGYANDVLNGFHATAYKSVDKPHRIIIAYRGTDPALFTGKTLAEKAQHALTTIQDIAVDVTMVIDTINPQKTSADAFTAQMLAKAAEQGISKDHVTVAGHSLGGALAQIEAAKFGLRGATFNAYGAASLRYNVPEGGTAVTNYVLAGDPVSAASQHYGTVVTLATPANVQALKDAHYLDSGHSASSPKPLSAMHLGDHSCTLFTGPQSVLAPERLAQLQANYANNKAAFDHFRHNIDQDRMGLSLLVNMTLRPGATTAMVATVEAVVLQSQVELAYDASRPTVERVINAAEHAAGQAYETLTHPGQWFGQSTPAASTPHPAVDRQHAQQHQTPQHHAPHVVPRTSPVHACTTLSEHARPIHGQARQWWRRPHAVRSRFQQEGLLIFQRRGHTR
jgi:hypothetical protein